MDPASTVEVTEQTRFCPQTDGQKDGRLREKHKCIVVRIDEDSSSYSESFKRVECTNWEYCRSRVSYDRVPSWETQQWLAGGMMQAG